MSTTSFEDEVYVTNFPATRFYLNLEHKYVKALRERLTSFQFNISVSLLIILLSIVVHSFV